MACGRGLAPWTGCCATPTASRSTGRWRPIPRTSAARARASGLRLDLEPSLDPVGALLDHPVEPDAVARGAGLQHEAMAAAKVARAHDHRVELAVGIRPRHVERR